METFLRLFGSLLSFVYHCFDRIVIFDYPPLLSRPEHIVYFFRDVHGVGAITKRCCASEPTITTVVSSPSRATGGCGITYKYGVALSDS